MRAPFARLQTTATHLPHPLAVECDYAAHYEGKAVSPAIVKLICYNLSGDKVPFREMPAYLKDVTAAPFTHYQVAGFDYIAKPGSLNPIVLGVSLLNSFCALSRQCCCSTSPDKTFMK